MAVAESQLQQESLRHLIPLNLLPQDQFKQLCKGLITYELREGNTLFERGADFCEWIYLLQGDVALEADGIIMDTVKGGTDAARFPLAQHVPRKVTARALTDLRYIQLDHQQLNLMENHRPKALGKSPSKGDWVTKLLKSPVFQRLPASNLQKIINQFEELEMESGQSIIKQGEDGDCLYIIKSGQCVVSRKPRPNAKEIKLGELRPGDMVGEDALITGAPRSVNVSMLADGTILKLEKDDFLELIAKPVLTKVSFETAYREVGDEAVWLDVRDPDQYKKAHIKESVNIPFFSLRMQLATLVRSRRYIVVCEDGTTSAAAAFLLLRFGFEAAFLDGGMTSVPEKSLVGEKVILTEEVSEEKEEVEQDEIKESPHPIEKEEKRRPQLLSHSLEDVSTTIESKDESAVNVPSPKISGQVLENLQGELKKLQLERDALRADKQQLQDKIKELETLLQRERARNETDELRQEIERARSERDRDQEKIRDLQQQVDELEGIIQQYFGTTNIQNVEVRVQSLIAEVHDVRDQADKEIESLQNEIASLKKELESAGKTSEAVHTAIDDKQESTFLSGMSAVDPQHLPLNSVVASKKTVASEPSKVSASILWVLVGVLLTASLLGIGFQMESGRRFLASILLQPESQLSAYEKSPAPAQNSGSNLEPADDVFGDETESDSALFEEQGINKAGKEEGESGDLFSEE